MSSTVERRGELEHGDLRSSMRLLWSHMPHRWFLVMGREVSYGREYQCERLIRCAEDNRFGEECRMEDFDG